MVTDRSKDRLNGVFPALAHPARRAMLARLSESELTVGELAEPFAMSRPAISKHLDVLERAGLVERIAAGRPRAHADLVRSDGASDQGCRHRPSRGGDTSAPR